MVKFVLVQKFEILAFFFTICIFHILSIRVLLEVLVGGTGLESPLIRAVVLPSHPDSPSWRARLLWFAEGSPGWDSGDGYSQMSSETCSWEYCPFPHLFLASLTYNNGSVYCGCKFLLLQCIK